MAATLNDILNVCQTISRYQQQNGARGGLSPKLANSMDEDKTMAKNAQIQAYGQAVSQFASAVITEYKNVTKQFLQLDHTLAQNAIQETITLSKERIKASKATLEKTLEVEIEIFNQKIGLAFDAYSKRANETAYAALNFDIERKAKLATLEQDKIEIETIKQINIEKEKTNRANEAELNNMKRGNAQVKQWLGYGKGLTDIINKAAIFLPVVGQAIATAVDTIMSVTKDAMEAKMELAETEMEQRNETRKLLTDTSSELETEKIQEQVKFIKDQIKIVEDYTKKLAGLAQTISGVIEGINKKASDIAANMGMSESGMKRFVTSSMNMGIEVASKFGKSTEDVMQNYLDYTQRIGRQVNLNNRDMETMFALQKKVGDRAMGFVTELFLFNKGAEDAAEITNTMLQNAAKNGLSQVKYADTLSKTLRLAQQYNFKEGTKSVMEMAIWAERTRFNMENLGNIINSFASGGIEGILQTSAQLQVLGGNAAIYSDPFGMLYETYNNPQALAKRLQNMTKGFGTFDTETGEVRFNAVETMQLDAISKATHRSVEELRGEVMERERRSQISKAVGGKYDEDVITKLGSSAHFDTKSKAWKVNVYDERTGRNVEKRVESLTKQDIENIRTNDATKDIATDVSKILSIMERQEGQRIRSRERLAKATYATELNESKKREGQLERSFNAGYSKTIQDIKEMMYQATNANSEIADVLANPQAVELNMLDTVKEIAKQIDDVIQNELAIINSMDMDKDQKKAYANLQQSAFSGGFGDAKDVNDALMSLMTKRGLGWAALDERERRLAKYNIDAWKTLDKVKTEDAIVNGNVIGVGTSVTPINDGVVGFSTDKEDTGIFGKKGGVFDNIINGSMDKKLDILLSKIDKGFSPTEKKTETNGNFKLNIDGDLRVNGNENVGNRLLGNEEFMRGLVKLIVEKINENQNFGRGELMYKRYSNF